MTEDAYQATPETGRHIPCACSGCAALTQHGPDRDAAAASASKYLLFEHAEVVCKAVALGSGRQHDLRAQHRCQRKCRDVAVLLIY